MLGASLLVAWGMAIAPTLPVEWVVEAKGSPVTGLVADSPVPAAIIKTRIKNKADAGQHDCACLTQLAHT